ncbi:MAG: 2OG-Fe(II) oxygenase family protein [Chloroflexota bacterium]
MRQGQFDEIPIIDVSPLLDGSKHGLKQVAEAVDYAYSQVGFAYIANHNLEPALVESIFAASAQFHALPHEEKLNIERNEFHRGFVPMNASTVRTSTLAKITKPNQSESFLMMGEQMAPDTPLTGPNQWPDRLPDFQATVLAYHDRLMNLTRQLIRPISVALGAPETFLDRHFVQATTYLRMLYYPPQPPQSPDDLFGAAPHTDQGFLTVLAQDEVGGLQVRNIAGDWIDAPPIPNTFVMNSGDMLHRWSNGRFISTPHRVINRSGKARYSNPFFLSPDMNSTIEAIPSTVTPDNPAKYEPIAYGEYVVSRIRKNYKAKDKD